MSRKAFSLAGVAGLFIAIALLAGCYAPLANQDGHLSLQITGRDAVGPTATVIVLVINGDYGDSLKEMLWLIDKGKGPGLSGSEADRLTTLGKDIATNGLVKFGGFPFYQTTVGGTSGSFEIPGIPAGRSYFVKLFVFNVGHSFDVKDIDKNFGGLIQLQNFIFTNESTTTPLPWTTPWQDWGLEPGQPAAVKSGESAPISMQLKPWLY